MPWPGTGGGVLGRTLGRSGPLRAGTTGFRCRSGVMLLFRILCKRRR